jgi:hypothetical protein
MGAPGRGRSLPLPSGRPGRGRTCASKSPGANVSFACGSAIATIGRSSCARPRLWFPANAWCSKPRPGVATGSLTARPPPRHPSTISPAPWPMWRCGRPRRERFGWVQPRAGRARRRRFRGRNAIRY